ncbi:DUF998 domain-containing protein [Granulicella sp. L46]|uniref:DUF998 domain-containing protein n=1 Tax=Granulicella sp. L46 TaxID=1641865 RepID=UPI00131D654F|nr:DUF998 domain-containing protein [Granulicella sp. L46]
MTISKRLLFGPAAAVIFAVGIVSLPLMIPGYSQVRQTVSEIGEVGSPARLPFSVMLCCVGALLLVFASAVGSLSRRRGHSPLAAWIIGFMAVPCIGIGIFAYPHPLHNVFGMLETIGYQAPIFLALSWRRDPQTKSLVRFSWIFFAIVWFTIAINFTVFHRYGTVWAHVKPIYGLVQRSLFAAWFIWCAGAALLLRRQDASSVPTESALVAASHT